MSKVVRGSDLLSGQSSINFNSGREYIANRRVDLLKSLNVPADVMTIVNRANNIFDSTGPVNNPTLDKNAATIARDSHLALMEVYRMEEPNNYGYLFGPNTAGQPDEKAALRKVASYFEVPTAKPLTQITVPPVRYEDRSVNVLNIADLPTEDWKVGATRLQQELATNADGTPSTVSRQDLERALANQGPFTPESINIFRGILDFMNRPHAVLPTQPAPMNLHQDGNLTVEFRTRAPVTYKLANNVITADLNKPSAFGNSFFNITIPAGAKLLAHQLNPNGEVVKETVYNAGTSKVEFRELGATPPPGSSMWLQVYSAQGEVMSNVRLPIPNVDVSAPTVPPSFRAIRKLRVLDANGNEVIPTGVNGISTRKEADNKDTYLR